MIDGLFFTFLNGGHVGFDTPEKAIALHNHCENGGFVFPYRLHAKYRCKVELWKNEAGQMGAFGVIEIVGAPPDLDNDMKYGLFSTKPTRKTKWQVRSLSQEEVSALTAIVTRPGNQRGNLVKHLRFNKAFAVHKTEGTHTTCLSLGDGFVLNTTRRNYIMSSWEAEEYIVTKDKSWTNLPNTMTSTVTRFPRSRLTRLAMAGA